MTKDIKELIAEIRALANKEGINTIGLSMLHNNPDFSSNDLNHHFNNDEDLVTLLLEHERREFEDIFTDNDFNDNYDAIEILLIVSKEIAGNFYNLSPSITHGYQEKYPEIFSDHMQKRIDFIFDKIQINLEKGIQEGLYRNDVSIELVARRYISRLLDLHDPGNFPPEDFSFATVFMQMFDSFLISIATEKGTKHYDIMKRNIDI